MKKSRWLALLGLALLALALPAVALAQPANDDFANATVVGSLPFSDTQDTSSATLEVNEPTGCAPYYYNPTGSVWYAFTPTSNAAISASTSSYFSTALNVYTGTAVDSLTLVGCTSFYGTVTIRPTAGTTYYFQALGLFGQSGPLTFNVDLTPPPTANFSYYPSDPSIYDTLQFYDNSYDPGGIGFQSEAWNFGDGTTATGCCPTHQYAKDADYTVQLKVTTTDGRTGSTSKVVHVQTHDVAIINLMAPTSASSGQTRQITVGVNSKRYPETVRVDIYKSVPGGFQQFGSLTQSVPVRSGNRTTNFSFNYTFTSADATVGKVTFEAVATIIGYRDALPADNTLIAPPTKVTK